MNNNVIKFPKKIKSKKFGTKKAKNRPVFSESFGLKKPVIKSKKQVDKDVNLLIENNLEEILFFLHSSGYNMKEEHIIKDVQFLIECFKSLMYRNNKIHHDIQKLIDKNCIFQEE